MSKEQTLKRILEEGILAVIRGPSEALTLKMVEALIRGGINGIEITFTTPNALAVIEALAKNFSSDILLGVGTVTELDQSLAAQNAGAQFLVSPHTDKKLVKSMVKTGLPVMAGAITPSEVMAALKWGTDIVKIFPGSLVGPTYIRALKGPYPDLKAMPTGGVTKDNIKDWFDAGAVAVGAGSNLCPKSWAAEGRFDDIAENAQVYREIVDNARLPNKEYDGMKGQ
jgi:2-dehydro-3-deoxyphosphogluconate aldolase/(4S)-4-hydroxy-2-oxoglutarate aldolase